MARDVEDALAGVYAKCVADLNPDRSYEALTAQHAADALRLQVEVASTGGRLSRQGDLQTILAEMDLRDIETIKIGNSTYREEFPRVSVELKRGEHGLYSETKSVKVSVEGSDRQWVGGVFDTITTTLEKDVPRWAIFRIVSTHIALGSLVGLGISGVIFASSDKHARHDASTAVGNAIILTIAGGMLGWVLLRPLFLLLFPGLEVVEPGGTPRGRRVLGGLVTILSLVLGAAGVILAALAL